MILKLAYISPCIKKLHQISARQLSADSLNGNTILSFDILRLILFFAVAFLVHSTEANRKCQIHYIKKLMSPE